MAQRAMKTLPKIRGSNIEVRVFRIILWLNFSKIRKLFREKLTKKDIELEESNKIQGNCFKEESLNFR